MKNKPLFIICVLMLFGISAKSQKAYKVQKNQKNRYEAYPNPFDFRPSGWLYDAGLTVTTSFDSKSLAIGDTTYSFAGPIRPGIKINAGRYQSLKKGHKLVKYIDYSVGYKMLWNTENQSIENTVTGNTSALSHTNVAHYANANLNLNNIISFNDYSFLQNTLGVNVDYRFAQNIPSSGLNKDIQPDAFVVQVHYKLALGFMIDNDKALIPYIELPVFNITPTQANFSQLDYFNQSYQTFIVGVRIMLFRLGQKNCPTAKGVGLDPNQKNGY